MVSKKVRLTWLYEMPTIVPELMKQGFDVFHFEASGDKKRVNLEAWRKVDLARRFECLGVGTEGCGRRFPTRGARSMHMRASGHTETQDHARITGSRKEQAGMALSRIEELAEVPA